MVSEIQSTVDLLGMTYKWLFPLKLGSGEMILRFSEMQSTEDLLMMNDCSL